MRERFHAFPIYFAGSLHTTKRRAKYILVAVEHLTGWLKIQALKNQTSESATRIFRKEIAEDIRSFHMIPSDNEPTFFSNAYIKELKMSGYRALTASAYRSRANGQTERMIQTRMKGIICMVLYDSNMRESASMTIESSCRVRPIEDSFSPFWLIYGAHGRIPIHARLEQKCVA